MSELKVYFEDITESMKGNPEVERWTSVVQGMSVYRVWQDENHAIVYNVGEDGKEKIADDETSERILDLTDNYLKGE